MLIAASVFFEARESHYEEGCSDSFKLEACRQAYLNELIAFLAGKPNNFKASLGCLFDEILRVLQSSRGMKKYLECYARENFKTDFVSLN